MDIRSYQARAHAAAGNLQQSNSSSEAGRACHSSGNLSTTNVGDQFSSVNVMQPYRPAVQASQAPMQPHMSQSPRQLFPYKDMSASTMLPHKQPYMSESPRSTFSSSMSSFPYEYRQQPDPRFSQSSVYGTPPPSSYPGPTTGNSRSPSSKINQSTSGAYYPTSGLPNGLEQRPIHMYNGEHKPSSVSAIDDGSQYLPRETSTPELESNRIEREGDVKESNTPSPKITSGYHGDAFTNPSGDSNSLQNSSSDPFAPSNRIMLPPHASDKSYGKQAEMMYNAPKTPSPLVSNGAPRQQGFQNSPRQPTVFLSVGQQNTRMISSNKVPDYSYRMSSPVIFNPASQNVNPGQLAQSNMSNGVPRKVMGPPPSPNHIYQQGQTNGTAQGYNYPLQNNMMSKSGSNPYGGVSASSAGQAQAQSMGNSHGGTSVSSTPSPTLNQLLTNTHPSQYKSTHSSDKNIPNEFNSSPNHQAIVENNNVTAGNNCDNSNHSEIQQMSEYSQNAMDMNNYMPSPSPSATSVSSLQEDESISSTLGMKAAQPQMSPQISSQSHPQMMPPMFHHPAMGTPHPMMQPHASPHMMHHGPVMPPTAQYNGTVGAMMASSVMRHPGQPSHMQTSPATQAIQANTSSSTSNSSGGSAGKDDERIDHFLFSLNFGQEPGRKEFCERLIKILEARNLMQSKVPCVAKQPVDLFRLYNIVKDKGGFSQVCNQKLWKDIANTMELNNSPMASYNIKKHYTKFLLPYECQYELNGAEPAAIIAECDAPPRKRPPRPKQPKGEGGKKGSKANAQAANAVPPLPNSSDTNGHTINVCDPFSDEFVNNQRPNVKNMPMSLASGGLQQSPPLPAGYYAKPPFEASHAYIKTWPGDRPPENTAPSANNGFGSPAYRPDFAQPGLVPSSASAVAPGTPIFSPQGVPHPRHMSPPLPQNVSTPSLFPSGGASLVTAAVRIPPGEVQNRPPSNFQTPLNASAESQRQAATSNRSSAFGGQVENSAPFPYASGSGLKLASPTGSVGAASGQYSKSGSRAESLLNVAKNATESKAMSFSDAKTVDEKKSRKAKPETEYFMDEKQPYWRESVEARDFDPNSVEATEIVFKPNLRVPAIYMNHGDAKKIMMSLKSGLKVETTWALETLTVVLFDDVTVHHLCIDSLPGIIDCLLGILQLHLDKLAKHRRKIEGCKDASSKDESVKVLLAKADAEAVATEKKTSNGFTSKVDRKRKHEDSPVDDVKEDKDSMGVCSAKRALAESPTSLDTLLRLKSMSLTKEDRDASSYNCLHTEVLEALRKERLSANGLKSSNNIRTRKVSACGSQGEHLSESWESARCDQLLQSNEEEMQLSAQRVLSITNIFRSFSCLPSNEDKLASHKDLLKTCSKLINLAHWHPSKKPGKRSRDLERNLQLLPDDWELVYIHGMRENCIVILSNLAAKINLDKFDESCVFGLLDCLVHWMVCKSCWSADPVPGAIHSTITMQRLALETLCKMCLAHNNSDYLLATPPSSRLVDLISILANMLVDSSRPAVRELALVLLTYLAKSDVGVSYIAEVDHFVSKVLAYLEESVALLAKHSFSSRNSSSYYSSSPSSSSQFDPSANLFMARSCSSLLLRVAQLYPNAVVAYRKQILLLTSSEIFATLDTEVYATLCDLLFELHS